MDWNGDGKHDWQDDAIMYHIIQEEKKAKNPPPVRRTKSGGWFTTICWIILIALTIKNCGS